MLRIIAGKYKNRVIPTLKKTIYRPSTSRLREALFSILTSGEFAENQILQGANILDAFCGSGSLGFEALSRGAKSVTFIDLNGDCLKLARQFATTIGELENTSFLNLNSQILPKAADKFDIVFIDPPYHNKLAEKAIDSLLEGGWLLPGALLVVEVAKTEDLMIPKNIQLIKERLYNNNKLLLLKYEQE